MGKRKVGKRNSFDFNRLINTIAKTAKSEAEAVSMYREHVTRAAASGDPKATALVEEARRIGFRHQFDQLLDEEERAKTEAQRAETNENLRQMNAAIDATASKTTPRHRVTGPGQASPH